MCRPQRIGVHHIHQAAHPMMRLVVGVIGHTRFPRSSVPQLLPESLQVSCLRVSVSASGYLGSGHRRVACVRVAVSWECDVFAGWFGLVDYVGSWQTYGFGKQ
jgi:hypothetical protein